MGLEAHAAIEPGASAPPPRPTRGSSTRTTKARSPATRTAASTALARPYRWTTEVTVHIDRHATAKASVARCTSRCSTAATSLAVAGITLPNDASVGRHGSLGFERVGGFAGIGWKHGRWHDVGWYQLQLHNPHDAPPPRVGGAPGTSAPGSVAATHDGAQNGEPCNNRQQCP
ncbi:hypothetical protein OM076_00750 [Solirubrobacter ginsenosidimutans]|uniref:Uncharacterized protein n=1 Tax=Solirubrobacter ginsenosidimutans TaxID=490573 RepID=A0A9X3RZZ6_9ACTN|nr:hypothetical protein [Solirubrobacter ginsenosidimutans]MDA0158776.1 hypothetical protein [Solirubrobacter ginsenosidimutans]